MPGPAAAPALRLAVTLAIALAGALPGTALAPEATPDPSRPPRELERLRDAGFELADAAAREETALALLGLLEHPDPALRDGIAFEGLSHWLRARALSPATVVALAERLRAMLAAPPDAGGFRRPFAALALAEVARADRLDPALPEEDLAATVERAAQFVATLADHRGFDPREGWRHGAAHGADLVLQLGLNPRVPAAGQRRLLEALAGQVAPRGVFYTFGEPERIARAVFFLHRRDELDAAFWDAWFARLGDPAPHATWGAAHASLEGLARRHDTQAFLHAVAFAARANPGPASDRLAALADRELVRIQGG